MKQSITDILQMYVCDMGEYFALEILAKNTLLHLLESHLCQKHSYDE